MNRGVLSLVVLLATACATMAPHNATIEGVVYTADGAPLPGVNVTLIGPGGSPTIITVTDDDGKYIVGGIRPGLYEVTTELQGFVTMHQRVPVTTDGKELVITRLRFVEPLAAAMFSST